MARIGFLGAGVMGGAMIRNLLGGGHEVCVYNRTLEKARALEADGATLAATPREAAAGADAIYSMVTNDDASRACWTGADGALAGDFKPGALAIEGSSVSRDWVLELAGLAAAKGLRFLDCPVAGRPDVAKAGTLWVYAGGAADDVEAARPILEPLSRSITHFGPTGSGIAFKLIYNVMGTIQVAALGEAPNSTGWTLRARLPASTSPPRPRPSRRPTPRARTSSATHNTWPTTRTRIRSSSRPSGASRI